MPKDLADCDEQARCGADTDRPRRAVRRQYPGGRGTCGGGDRGPPPRPAWARRR